MKILVVEDESKTGNYLKRGLSEAGFVVDLAWNGTRQRIDDGTGLGLAITRSILRAHGGAPLPDR